jgi:IstB-like ATP binding protein
MERTEVLDMMSSLKLYGLRSAYDETLATAIKRKHEPQRFVGDLLKAEISEKQARSIKYQLTVAKLPLAKDVDDFVFKNTPINEALVRDLAAGGLIAQQRNLVLVGGPVRADVRLQESQLKGPESKRKQSFNGERRPFRMSVGSATDRAQTPSGRNPRNTCH